MRWLGKIWMGAVEGFEEAKMSNVIEWLPCVLLVAITLPMNEVEVFAVADVHLDDPFDDVLLGVGSVDWRCGWLVLTGVSGGVWQEEGGVKDRVDGDCGRQVELEGDVREYTEDPKGTEVLDIEFERGPIGGNVATVEPDEIAGLEDRRGTILAVFPWKGGRTTRSIGEVLVGALSSEDVISDLGMKSAELGDSGIGGGVVRGGSSKEVGRRERVETVVGEERRVLSGDR